MREKFRELVKRKNRIHANLELVQWDLETKTPIKSRPYLSELVGELSMKDYALSTSDEFVNLVEELNKQNLNCPQNFVDSMVSLLNELGKNINYKFASIDVRAYTSKQSEYESERPAQTQVANQVQSNAHTATSLNFSAHTDIKSINDREYRDFFINLSLELLKDDLRNVNAYAIFMQALWGRIKALPASNDFITPVRYPEQNLIINIKNIESLNLENLAKKPSL